MPIYEYQCEDCGNVFEALVFSGQTDSTCPKCGSSRLVKLMSPSAAYSGASSSSLPGPGDTGCCGYKPGEAPGCSGPGSCCGRNKV